MFFGRLISAAKAWHRTQKVLATAPAQELKQIHHRICLAAENGRSHLNVPPLQPSTAQALEAQGYRIFTEKQWYCLHHPGEEYRYPPTFTPYVVSWGPLPGDEA